MFGALRFYEAARPAGVKPIIGVEAYVAPGSRFDRNPGEREEKYHHLTLLAENETGYRNLLRLVSLAHLEGFYHRPRMDKQLLAEHAEGVICLSGCLSSEIGVAARRRPARTRAATAAASTATSSGPTLLHRAAGPRARRTSGAILAEQIEIARDRSGSPSSPRTTSTTRCARTRSRTTCCCASSSRSSSRTRSGCGSTPRSST